MFLLFTTFWACSLIRVSLIRVCSLPRSCFSTPKGLHVSRRGGLKPLIHPSAWNRYSRKFISKILHNHTPVPHEITPPDIPHSPTPLELVTPMDGYARWWMPS